MMPYRLSALLFASLCSANVTATTQVTLLADAAYAPYSFAKDGKAEGIYTDLIRMASKRMKDFDLVIKPVPWKRGLNHLKEGTEFALYPPYFRLDERPYIWPYSQPILEERAVVFCHEDILGNALRPHWPEDYFGLTVGNNAGFNVGGPAFNQALADKKIFMYEAKNSKSNLLRLGLKRTDCYMNDRFSILYELRQLKNSGGIKPGVHAEIIEGATISIESGFIGYTNQNLQKFPFKDKFVKRFDQAIYSLKREGFVGKLISQYTT